MISKCIELYEGRDDVTLTTYVLADSPEMLSGKARGAVLICPGGAYLSCSDREGEPVAMAFNAMGYHAFVLRYSVYSEGKPFTPSFEEIPLPKEHCQFPKPTLDIAHAMRLINSKAEEWNVDIEKIALCGFSAGAHNCAMYSVYWNKPLVTDVVGTELIGLRPAACILGYPLSDYVYLTSYMENLKGDDFYSQMIKGLFSLSMVSYVGTVQPDMDMCKKASPARLVDKDTPPTFLWATSEDSLVNVKHSTLMATALAEQGIPFEIHVFEKGAHGLSLATQASSGNMTEIDPAASEWINLCRTWLDKRFALDLPAQPPYMDMMPQ